MWMVVLKMNRNRNVSNNLSKFSLTNANNASTASLMLSVPHLYFVCNRLGGAVRLVYGVPTAPVMQAVRLLLKLGFQHGALDHGTGRVFRSHGLFNEHFARLAG